jgi:hypothetical protein
MNSEYSTNRDNIDRGFYNYVQQIALLADHECWRVTAEYRPYYDDEGRRVVPIEVAAYQQTLEYKELRKMATAGQLVKVARFLAPFVLHSPEVCRDKFWWIVRHDWKISEATISLLDKRYRQFLRKTEILAHDRGDRRQEVREIIESIGRG